MRSAVSKTSPLLYLYRIDAISWLSHLFREIWTPTAVVDELRQGQRKGYDVSSPGNYSWVQIVDPQAMPSEWLSLDLGAGERAAMALASKIPAALSCLLDDLLARRTAQAPGLTVWGTLKVLLEAKAQGLTQRIEPIVTRLDAAGMCISEDVRR